MIQRLRPAHILVAATLWLWVFPSHAAPWASVNGQNLDDRALTEAIAQVNKRLGPEREMTAQQRSALKGRIGRVQIAEALIAQRLKKERIKASNAQFDAALDRYKKRFNNDKGFKAFLGITGHTEASFRASLKKEVLYENLVAKLLRAKPPTSADVERALEENRDQFRSPESARMRQILIKKATGASEEEVTEQRARARSIYQQVARAPRAFPDLARRKSEGPTALQGGQLGRIQRGRMGEAFDRLVFRADPGTVVGPIETETAFHIVLVEKRFGEEPARFVKRSRLAADALYRQYVVATWGPLMKRLYADANVLMIDAEVKVTVEDLVAIKGKAHLMHEGPAHKTSAQAQGKRARPSRQPPARKHKHP